MSRAVKVDAETDVEGSCPECGTGPDEWCDEGCQCVACQSERD